MCARYTLPVALCGFCFSCDTPHPSHQALHRRTAMVMRLAVSNIAAAAESTRLHGQVRSLVASLLRPRISEARQALRSGKLLDLLRREGDFGMCEEDAERAARQMLQAPATSEAAQVSPPTVVTATVSTPAPRRHSLSDMAPSQLVSALFRSTREHNSLSGQAAAMASQGSASGGAGACFEAMAVMEVVQRVSGAQVQPMLERLGEWLRHNRPRGAPELQERCRRICGCDVLLKRLSYVFAVLGLEREERGVPVAAQPSEWQRFQLQALMDLGGGGGGGGRRRRRLGPPCTACGLAPPSLEYVKAQRAATTEARRSVLGEEEEGEQDGEAEVEEGSFLSHEAVLSDVSVCARLHYILCNAHLVPSPTAAARCR